MNRFRKNKQQANSDQSDDITPLREFNPYKKSADPQTRKIRDRKRKLRSMLPFFILIVMIIVGALIALTYYGDGENISGSNDKFAFGETIEPQELLQAFISSNFEDQNPERLNTIRVSGTIESDGAKQEFVLYKKQPSMALLVLTYGLKGDITFGMDGDIVWQRIEAQNGATQSSLVDKETARSIKETGRFFTPFVQYALTYNGLDPALKINDKRDETGLIEVSFTDPFTAQPSLAKLDGASLHVKEMENINEDGTPLRALYKDYEIVSGFHIPKTIEYYSDGAPTQTIHIEKAVTNSGILSQFFQVPNELSLEAPESEM